MASVRQLAFDTCQLCRGNFAVDFPCNCCIEPPRMRSYRELVGIDGWEAGWERIDRDRTTLRWSSGRGTPWFVDRRPSVRVGPRA